MTPLAFLAAAAFAVSAPSAPLLPDPATDALVETLVSILPDRADIEKVSPPDPDQLAFLTGLNPGRESEAKAVLEDYQRCLAPASTEGVKTMFRKAARSIGPAKTQRMIDFYRLDRATMEGLMARLRGPAPSAADKAEEARLYAEYPLQEYYQAYRRAMAQAGDDSAFVAAATRCGEALSAALVRAGLKSE
jgi:hypothetical protein